MLLKTLLSLAAMAFSACFVAADLPLAVAAARNDYAGLRRLLDWRRGA